MTGVQTCALPIFIIEPDGTISNIQAERPLHPLHDAEAIRVVGLIPGQWVPATIDGQPVRSYFYTPVLFSDPADQ